MSVKPLLPPGLVRVYDRSEVGQDTPCLISLPITEQGRRFAEQSTTYPNALSSRNVPLLDHAGAEASIWTKEKALSVLERPSFLTGRKPRLHQAEDFAVVAHAYENVAVDLQKAGISTAVLALDDDGLLAGGLDANSSDFSVAALVAHLSGLVPNLGVSLCVEALAPGGHDATTGISRAKQMVKAGASFVVATCGSWAFPPLKFRKVTKARGKIEVAQNDAWLASPAWLLGHLACPVYACGPLKNIDRTTQIADQLGFAGLIEWQHHDLNAQKLKQ